MDADTNNRGGRKMNGQIEYGKCEICGKEAQLERTYFFYPVNCTCHGSIDERGQNRHFEMVTHCKDCPAPMPKEIEVTTRDYTGHETKTKIKGLLPIEIQGMFIIDDSVKSDEKE